MRLQKKFVSIVFVGYGPQAQRSKQMQSGIVFRMTIVFAAKAHKSWPYTSVTNVSDELSLEIRAGYMLEVANIIEFSSCISGLFYRRIWD